jgi:hypothetical protein
MGNLNKANKVTVGETGQRKQYSWCLAGDIGNEDLSVDVPFMQRAIILVTKLFHQVSSDRVLGKTVRVYIIYNMHMYTCM